MHKRNYVLKLIFEAGLDASKPAITPINTNVKLTSKLYDEHIGKNLKREEDPSIVKRPIKN